jgi:hypothetical protein
MNYVVDSTAFEERWHTLSFTISVTTVSVGCWTKTLGIQIVVRP